MRIVVVFLMLAAVSIFGVSLFLRTAQDSPFSLWTGLTTQAAPPAAEDPPQPAAQSQPAPPVTQPVSQPAANPVAPVQQVQPGETVTFTIKSGETTSSVAKRLAEAGLTRHELLFRFMVQWRGAEGRLQAGDYQLREGMTEDELIEALQSAKARDVAITFIEGRRIEEFAEMLEKADIGISGQRFLDLARRGNFTYDFLETKPAGATLEGFLFPDTYRVIPGKTTAEELVHAMLKKFGEQFPAPLREAAQRNTGLNLYQVVTVASIVEREAQVREERPRIAAVYVNRLRDREGLFADPTIQYAVGKAGDWWPVLRDSPRNIAPESRYNTYVHGGVPPSPIANPGASALKAVAEPEKTDFKYFVRNDIANNGSHVFSRTLAEHEANRVRYSRQ
jgi:UPF0755 protein